MELFALDRHAFRGIGKNSVVLETFSRQIESDGYAMIPSALDEEAVRQTATELSQQLHVDSAEPESIRTRSGAIYAARNVMELMPSVIDLWQTPLLLELIQNILGPDAGLVRVLYFDKPPERTWTLPWHKDLTIAIRPPGEEVQRQFKVNRKGGVPHVEAPLEVLQSMLALRLHLDEVTLENGPLKVVAGSHRTGKRLTLDDGPQLPIFAGRGDILAIRPLVSHSSARSAAGTTRHRRVLHFELSGTSQLPDGLEWRHFVRPNTFSVA